MPTPRNQQISITDTPYYHCVSRCVRRAFLCGKDNATGKSYEHRRVWVEQRTLQLAQIFAIDVCAYAVMHDHTHLVLFIDTSQALSWNTEDVIKRWHLLYSGTLFTQQFSRGELLTTPVMKQVEETAEIYRQRLQDISWFMRALNEPIARQANKEDHCTGRFWEGRFKSQALLDETALAACMAYVDLNPVRAAIAETPERSAFTSIQLRIKAALNHEQPKSLLNFVGDPKQVMPKGLPFELTDYLQLVDLTGRCMRNDKRGFIHTSLPNILSRLNMSADNWLVVTHQFEDLFSSTVGNADSIEHYCQQHHKRRQGITHSQRYFA